jgi:hypothetical protein
MVRISVVNAIWGERYHQFVSRWWAGVESLERKPDEVLIVAASDSAQVMKDSVPKGFKKITRVIVSDNENFNDYWDLAFASASGEWLAGCSIDDWFLPEALSEIDAAAEAGCELVCDSVVLHPSGKVFEGRWDSEAIFSNLVMPGVAPMSADLYHRIGGFDRDIYFSDWGFYIKAAAAGVKVHQTNIQRVVYDEGLDHETMSGPLKPAHVDQMAHQQIQDLARRLRG